MDREAAVRTKKCHVYMNAVCQDPTIGAISFPGGVHQVELGRVVSESCYQRDLNAEKAIPMELDAAGGISNLVGVQPKEVDSTILQASNINGNAGNPYLLVSSATRTTSRSRLSQFLTKSRRCRIHCGSFWTSSRKSLRFP